jgi:anti-sigma factor RsiW
MNNPTLIGPCADYEHELVDLQDGELADDRARALRVHLGQCARCRAWAAEFAALDARLATDLPRPALSPTFDARLQERLAALARPAVRGDLRAALVREHDSLVHGLRRVARRRAALGAVGSAAATLCLLAAARSLLAQHAGLLHPVAEGPERWVLLGAIGSAIALAALAWSVARSGMPGLGWRR